MTDKTMFTEMDQYQWFNDIDELSKVAKLNTSRRLMSEIPPAPLSLVLTIIKDMTSRPEIMAAYGSAPVKGQIEPEEGYLLMWFSDYLTYKYGNETQAVDEAKSYMRELANGVYIGPDDPKLRAVLIADDDIYDDGVTPA
uniref:hypothetical protein n=1 Tax=Pararhizobium sp. IMCC3301 TaxID=3067904 RepID=UPI002741704D|nr:hypothetical protein [Pararhizobium sp. IMCC3301]